jgi:hypothetical protein
MEVIARLSERSAVCFIGWALDVELDIDEFENPSESMQPLVAAVKGGIVLAKSDNDFRVD